MQQNIYGWDGREDSHTEIILVIECNVDQLWHLKNLNMSVFYLSLCRKKLALLIINIVYLKRSKQKLCFSF